MLKSWLAPKDVDRPVLAEIAIDPLFKEFITLEPYNDSCRKKCCPVHEGFMVRSDIFAGRKSKPGGDVITGMFQGKDEQSYGQVQVLFSYGDLYQGSSINTERHGPTRTKSAAGHVEEVEYIHDLRHGLSVIKYANGQIIEQNYVKNVANGPTTIKFENGCVAKGQKLAGKEHGTWEHHSPANDREPAHFYRRDY